MNDKPGSVFSKLYSKSLGLTAHKLLLSRSNIEDDDFKAYVGLSCGRHVRQDLSLLENITELCPGEVQELSPPHLSTIATVLTCFAWIYAHVTS